ncbi:MAG: Gfo/Idh/MocA family oxidoreductase [Treponema sp.]|jgi:predicted dehydrogenase|nr:Gfo/Idh/MocA family oxidoreductase [Treponema sp.]
MGKKIRWGIVGTGYIANNFANGSKVVEDMEIVACSATSLDKANVFADTYGIDLRFDDFDAMLEKAKPDVVYIGIPNMLHFKFVMKALEKGINVLCEKPMADNTGQLLRMIEKAKEKKFFYMEAM